jgi:cytochrome bd-type quinol oxidase subunit 1
MLTKDAVTEVPNLWITFFFLSMIYVVLAIAVVFLMRKQVFLSMGLDDADNT